MVPWIVLAIGACGVLLGVWAYLDWPAEGAFGRQAKIGNPALGRGAPGMFVFNGVGLAFMGIALHVGRNAFTIGMMLAA